MHPAPTTPLGQAFAAIIAMLIVAIAEYAAEHPLLAPGLRATIRQLEAMSKRFDAMVAEWQANTPRSPRRRTGPRTRRGRHTRPASARHPRPAPPSRVRRLLPFSTAGPRAPPYPKTAHLLPQLPRHPAGREPPARTPRPQPGAIPARIAAINCRSAAGTNGFSSTGRPDCATNPSVAEPSVSPVTNPTRRHRCARFAASHS
jgi:hypothetical protein